MTVDKVGFTWYTILHTCALQGTTAYQVALSDYPWSPICNIVVNLQASEPWIKGGQNSTSRRTSAPAGSNYVLDMFNEAVLRLKWNTTITYMPPKPFRHELMNLRMPLLLGAGFGTVNVALYSHWQANPPGNEYACSRSFAPELDGFSVVVRSSIEGVSLIRAVLQMVVGAPFVNFSCFLFLVLIVVGHVYWFLEKNENGEQFSPVYAKGILDSAWFCIVTMATVGYGDKVKHLCFGTPKRSHEYSPASCPPGSCDRDRQGHHDRVDALRHPQLWNLHRPDLVSDQPDFSRECHHGCAYLPAALSPACMHAQHRKQK